MTCEVKGELVPATFISYRELGFSDSVEIPTYPYSLKYDLFELRDLIAEDTNDFVRDMKLDYEITGDTHPKYLHDLGYPAIDTLVKHEDALCGLIRSFLYSELFRVSFPWSPPYRDVLWIINNINDVCCRDGVIIVRGKVYRKVES